MDTIYIRTKSGMVFTTEEIRAIGNKLKFKDKDTLSIQYVDFCHISSISIFPPPFLKSGGDIKQ